MKNPYRELEQGATLALADAIAARDFEGAAFVERVTEEYRQMANEFERGAILTEKLCIEAQVKAVR